MSVKMVVNLSQMSVKINKYKKWVHKRLSDISVKEGFQK